MATGYTVGRIYTVEERARKNQIPLEFRIGNLVESFKAQSTDSRGSYQEYSSETFLDLQTALIFSDSAGLYRLNQ